MCEQLDEKALEALANALGAPDPHYPVYPLLTQIIANETENIIAADIAAGVFTPVPRHTAYVSPAWSTTSLPAGYYTSIAAAYAAILAQTPVPLASDKYVIFLNAGHYSEAVPLISNVDLVGIDRDAVFLDGAVTWAVGVVQNSGAFALDETVSLSGVTITNGLAANGNTAKSAALLQLLRLQNVNVVAGAVLSGGLRTVIKNSTLSDAWLATGAGTTTIITGSAANDTFSYVASLGSNSYIFDTTYPSGSLSTDATSGIDRQYELIFTASIVGTILVAIPVRYVNATYVPSPVSTNQLIPSAYGTGSYTVSTLSLGATAATPTQILLTQPFDALLLE
jgi:hypothetical protein